jgi:hypothetical protein
MYTPASDDAMPSLQRRLSPTPLVPRQVQLASQGQGQPTPSSNALSAGEEENTTHTTNYTGTAVWKSQRYICNYSKAMIVNPAALSALNPCR